MFLPEMMKTLACIALQKSLDAHSCSGKLLNKAKIFELEIIFW